MLKLIGYNFEIQYKAGSENQAADALSRVPTCITLMALSIQELRDLDEIYALVDDDVFLSNIKKGLQHKPTAYPN